MPLLLDGKSDQLLRPTQEKSNEAGGKLLTAERAHGMRQRSAPSLILSLRLSHTPSMQVSFH